MEEHHFISIGIFAFVMGGYLLGYMSGYTARLDTPQVYECETDGE